MNAPPTSLTTHVLDLTSGRPAGGLGIVLSRLGATGGAATPLGSFTTNADGRTDDPLLTSADLSPGRYELAFSVGEYFADHRGEPESAPYLDVVPVHFGVAAGTGHLHVALLITPWSYTTYRGS